MAKKCPISTIIYDFEVEVAYWDNYISRLIDFIRNEKLTDEQVNKIQCEISRVEFYKKEKCIEMSELLKITDKLNSNGN